MAVLWGCIYGVCFNCAINEQNVKYTKSRKNFYKTYCNLRENVYNKDSYTKTRNNTLEKGFYNALSKSNHYRRQEGIF